MDSGISITNGLNFVEFLALLLFILVVAISVVVGIVLLVIFLPLLLLLEGVGKIFRFFQKMFLTR